MVALRQPLRTVEEYFALERTSQEKHEFLDGQIYAMAGASLAHITITDNTFVSLRQQVRGKGCRSFSSEMRVKTVNSYFYPDLSVVCGEPIFIKIQGLDTLVNPTLVVEVLSPTTSAFDLGEKFDHYRKLDSLQEYILIAQHKPQIQRYVRQPNGDWLLTSIEGLDKQIDLRSVGCTLSLAEVYENVSFEPPEAESAES